MSDRVTQIVVVGGGAGGLELATRLGRRYRRNPGVDVLLVDRNRTHIWKPLLHEVAAGSLDANLDEVGYGAHGHRWGFRFFLGTLEAIDRGRREIVIAPMRDDDGSELLARQRIPYDHLVMAVGSVTNDFGTSGVRAHCVFLDQRQDAERFRQRLLNHCLRVSRAGAASDAKDAQVEIAIVGGGATGVELAAELFDAAAALRQYGLEGFDEHRLRVTLLEAGPRILPALPKKLAAAAHEELESLGVRILVGSLMGNLIGGRMAVEGRLARFVYLSLYRMHLIAIHGWFRGVLLIAIGRVNQVVRPRLKLH